MKKIINKIAEVKSNFFLKKHTPSGSTMKLLKDLYPSVNWNRVDFYEGLPWFTPYIAPHLTAQALPQFYSFSRYRIYTKNFDESKPQYLADIVHEGYHVMQAMQFWKGYGLGFFRGLMLYYNALFIKHGYRSNPFEITAHDQENRFMDYCEKSRLDSVAPKNIAENFCEISKEEPLVFSKYKFRYEGSYLNLTVSVIFCSLVTITKPFADVLVFGIGLIPVRVG